MVSEIDAAVVRLDRERLDLAIDEAIDVRVEDGRLGLRRIAAGSQDLVVGDAFGGMTVPWHLTTREAVSEVRRVLAPGGVYVANLIDHRDLAFARAAVATLRDTFDHVALAAAPATLAREAGGNMVAVAGDQPLDPDAFGKRLAAREAGWGALDGAALDAWVGPDARVLTDDHAPVDQLLTGYRRRS